MVNRAYNIEVLADYDTVFLFTRKENKKQALLSIFSPHRCDIELFSHLGGATQTEKCPVKLRFELRAP